MAVSPGDDDLEHQAAGEGLAEGRQDIVKDILFLPFYLKGVSGEEDTTLIHHVRYKDTDFGLHNPASLAVWRGTDAWETVRNRTGSSPREASIGSVELLVTLDSQASGDCLILRND